MNTELWKQHVVEILTNIADENFQKKIWFSDTLYCSTPGELYCILFDDYSIELFIDDNDVNLNANQKANGKILINLMDEFSEECGDNMTAENTINNLKWKAIRKQAERFLHTLNQPN
ncbi:hypothetical protein [Thalassomonas actiniarum]|uniref:Uncharacterized protein n=1 Tax=Thalassomonas actiniarum TaxID=485447 RepID=A0AAE9YP94_9GAMM|nr:hypothetical protein [Thalassomonas actiniarum]WDD97739.1 hypothetical protein SG35_020910 [Thalassomonas actiniarum]